MLEILVLLALTKSIGKIVETKGYKAGLYKTITVLLWFGGEIVGASIGVVLFDNRLLVYLIALIGAGAGAVTAYLIAKSIPEVDEKIPFVPSSAKFILLGAIGFGLGLAVARVGWAYLSTTLGLYRSYGILLFGYRIGDVISYIFAGSLGGGMLALGYRKRIFLWALAGLVGGIVGYLITLPVCCVLNPNPIARLLGSIFGDGGVVVMSGLTNMLVGFFVGGALGVAQKNQKWILPLAFSGMGGWGTYGLFSRLILKWRSDLLVASTNDPSLTLLLYRTTWLTEILLGVIGGVIVGVCLGWTLRKLS